MSETDKQVILSLADNNMNITKTSKVLFMHRNTAVYHLGRVKKITGLDPMNFYHLHKLVEMIREKE